MAKKAIVIFPFGILASFAVSLFLSGKIIYIPKGTTEGGIISAVGVFIILVCTFVLIYAFFKIRKMQEKK